VSASPTPTAEDYRYYGTLCARMPEAVSDEFECKVLVQMATQWNRLANYREKQSGRATKNPSMPRVERGR
jgi:hypothetical protein